MPTLTDEDVEALLQLCPNLRRLDLSENHDNLSLRTFDALRAIDPQPQLEALLLPRPKQLTHFRLVSVLRRYPDLQVLDVPFTQPSTSALFVSARIESLRIGGPVTEDLIGALLDGALPCLQELALLHCPGPVLVELARRLPLESVALPLEFSLDDLFALLQACGPRLRHLSILARLQDDHAEDEPTRTIHDLGSSIAEHCPGLRTFASHAPSVPLFSDGLARLFETCSELTRVHLSHFTGTGESRPTAAEAMTDWKCEGPSSATSWREPCKTTLSLRSCPRIASLVAGPWLRRLAAPGASTSGTSANDLAANASLEELQLERLPRLAPNAEEVTWLAEACRDLHTLALGHLPRLPATTPEHLLAACSHGLVELSLCDLRLGEGAWAAIPRLRALRDLTLRELAPDPHNAQVAEEALLEAIRECGGLRRLDLYRMGAAITDRLVLRLMAENLLWIGGQGLRWLRLDLRFGAANSDLMTALAASSGCAYFELRLFPADPTLPQRSEPALAALPRVQALIRAWGSRRAMRQRHLAATRVQAVVRGDRTRRCGPGLGPRRERPRKDKT